MIFNIQLILLTSTLALSTLALRVPPQESIHRKREDSVENHCIKGQSVSDDDVAILLGSIESTGSNRLVIGPGACIATSVFNATVNACAGQSVNGTKGLDEYVQRIKDVYVASKNCSEGSVFLWGSVNPEDKDDWYTLSLYRNPQLEG